MAMKKIMKDERTSLILGDKIKGYGDPNSRTRKRLEHQPYMVKCTMYIVYVCTMYMYVQCICNMYVQSAYLYNVHVCVSRMYNK